MPIYDHICDHCGHAFSVVRSYSDPPVLKCPSCGKTPRRLIASPAIVFKGSGWYKTDSRASSSSSDKDGAKVGAGSGEPGKADAKSGDAKGSDAKGGDPKSGDAKGSNAKPSGKGSAAPSEAPS